MTTSETAPLGVRINEKLDLPGGYAMMRAALRGVIEVHRESRIFDDCGHHHDYAEDGSAPAGLIEVPEVGLVCEAEGYQYSICWACCTGTDGVQSEHCASEHDQLGVQVRMTAAGKWEYRGACWPCATVRAVAEALQVQP